MAIEKLIISISALVLFQVLVFFNLYGISFIAINLVVFYFLIISIYFRFFTLSAFFSLYLVSIIVLYAINKELSFTLVPVFLPFLIYVSLALLFFQSLFSSRSDLISRFMMDDMGSLNAHTARIGRLLTLIWSLLLFAMAFLSVILFFFLDKREWHFMMYVVNPSFLFAFFYLQHHHAKTYRPDGKPASIRRTIRTMMRPSFWA